MRGLKIGALALSVIIAATGCTVKKDDTAVTSNTGTGSDIVQSVLLTEVPGTDQIPDAQAWDMYDMTGEIIQINGNDIALLTGDIAQNYTLSEDNIKKVFLGQTVGVVQLEDGTYKAEPFIIKDFSVRFTNMGQMIETKSGILTDIQTKDDAVEITAEIDGESYTSSYSGDAELFIGKTYEYDLINIGGNSYISEVYDPNSLVAVTISGFSRSEDGRLIISASDQVGGEYVIPLDNVVLNFNYTDLKVGDTLKVYVTSVMESMPMQIRANRIVK